MSTASSPTRCVRRGASWRSTCRAVSTARTGAVRGYAPQAALTVTFFRLKPGHLLLPGRELCGEIGAGRYRPAQRRAARRSARDCFANLPELWHLPTPGPQSHKYSRGHVTVVGGATMTGAARLAADAARRAGAGLVTIAATRARRRLPRRLAGRAGQRGAAGRTAGGRAAQRLGLRSRPGAGGGTRHAAGAAGGRALRRRRRRCVLRLRRRARGAARRRGADAARRRVRPRVRRRRRRTGLPPRAPPPRAPVRSCC